jgi:hypothetical protein
MTLKGNNAGHGRKEKETMKLFRVIDSEEADTTWEAVGEEIRRLHRTRRGAQNAIKGMGWDEQWGKEPVLEVAEVHAFKTTAAARANGWEVVK